MFAPFAPRAAICRDCHLHLAHQRQAEFLANSQLERQSENLLKAAEKIEKQKEAEAHLTSYINKDQFDILFESTLEINQKIYQHSEIVDELERDLLKINRKRKQKKEKQNLLERSEVSSYN